MYKWIKFSLVAVVVLGIIVVCSYFYNERISKISEGVSGSSHSSLTGISPDYIKTPKNEAPSPQSTSTNKADSEIQQNYQVSLPPPSGLAGQPSGTGVKLIWDPLGPPEAEVNYKIYRRSGNGDYSAISATTQTSFVDNQLLIGTTYSYYITDLNAIGVESDPSNAVTVDFH